MLYMNGDGNFTLDDKPTPSWFGAERRREERERMAENAARYERMKAQVAEYERQKAIAREVAERDEIVELAEMAWESSMAELGAFGSTWPEEEPPMEFGTREDFHAYLTARLDVLDEECEESGVADALDWERWDEYENAMYCLAEFEVGMSI